jgi:anti-sigma factor RsiW
MNEPEYEKLRSLLRAALPPIEERDPPDDLWPLMLRRLDHQPASAPWFDFVLAGVAAAVLIAFPQVIPWMLLQC